VVSDDDLTFHLGHGDLRLLGLAAALLARYHARATDPESTEHAEEHALEQLLEGMAMGAELPLEDDIAITVRAPDAAPARPHNNHNRRS
jgi:hypothetical protein